MKKEAQRKLEEYGGLLINVGEYGWDFDGSASYISQYEDCWNNMTGAERKKLFKDFFGGVTKYTTRLKREMEYVKKPEKEAKKEFSELSEILRVDIINILSILSFSTHKEDIELLGTYCDFKAKEKLNHIAYRRNEVEARLQRMDESNNSGMAEYNRRKEKQENFYWKYFRRTSSYIRPEWYGDKPSEDRISDEEFDGLIDEYLTGMHDSDENYEETTTFRHLSYLFITEFAKRREAQSRFTEDSQTKDKKARRGKREITEEDLEGTHYDLLKVSMDASLKEIKEAWKELILKWHPDRHQKNPKLAERMAIALNIAKEVLSDRTKRKKYDEELDQRFV